MLKNSLKQISDTVFIDLLNCRDIEFWKSRVNGKGQNQNMSMSSSSSYTDAQLNGKRYLILTETTEFDRVHYPIPLLLVEDPHPQ
jgi:coiled-coil domain-containing protein 61